MKEKTNINGITIVMYIVLLGIYCYKMRLGATQDELSRVIITCDWLPNGSGASPGVISLAHIDGLFFMPTTWLFIKITGEKNGIFLFYRCLFIFVQLIISLSVYCEFSYYIKKQVASILSIIYFCYFFSFQMIGYKTQLMWFSMVALVFLARYGRECNIVFLLFVAICIALASLSYITSALLIIPTIVYVYHKSRNIKHIFCVLGVYSLCILSALIFVIGYIGLDDLIKGTYATYGVAIRERHLLHGINNLLEIVLVLFVSCVGLFFAKKVFRKVDESCLCITISLLLFIFAVALKTETATQSRVWYVLLCISGWGFCQSIRSEKSIVRILNGFSIALIIAISMATNQSIAIVAFGFVYTLMAFVVVLMDNTDNRYAKYFVYVIVALFFVNFAFFVPENNYWSDGVGNIFSKRFNTLSDDPLEGIYLKEVQYSESMKLKEVIDCYTSEDDVLLLLDGQTYGYLASDAKRCMENMYYSESDMLKKHFDFFPDSVPTVVVFKTDNPITNDSWFSKWIGDHYEEEALLNGYYVYRIL